MKKMLIALAASLLAISGTANAQDPDGNDRRVLILNDSNDVVYTVRGSNVTRTSYEDDILGNNIIMPNGRSVIGFYDGTGHCMYDLRISMGSGRVITRNRVNVCTLMRWRIHNNDDHLEY